MFLYNGKTRVDILAKKSWTRNPGNRGVVSKVATSAMAWHPSILWKTLVVVVKYNFKFEK